MPQGLFVPGVASFGALRGLWLPADLPALPAGFSWPGGYPLTFGFNGSRYSCDFDPASYAAAALAGTQYYVSPTGSDAANGLTPGTAVRSIWRATQLASAAAAPFKVAIAAGSYPRENGFANTGTIVPNTQPAAYIASGLVECWSGSNLTWPGSPDATHTNTYVTARSNVARVLDLSATDANGDYVELTKVADAATCNATPNSWAQVSGNVYVRRTGAPTNANTRVLLLSTANFGTHTTMKDVFVSGIDFQGGANGAVAVNQAATMNAMFLNCSAKFAGAVGVNANGFAFDNMTGLIGLKGCVAACNEADGINGHWTPGGASGLYVLTVDCIGRNNGRNSVLSCNGITQHESIVSIDVNGTYHGNYGANVIPIGTCKMLCLGTYAYDSKGDVVHGGATTPTDFQTQNTAVMWMQGTRSGISGTSINASNTSTINRRRHSATDGQTEVKAAGATLANF